MGRTDILKNNIYIPDAGDLVWADFDPAVGREQKGLRPALVLSSRDINKYSDLIIACPITSIVKNNVLNVNINSKKVNGQILVNQIKTMDWRNRKINFIEKVEEDVLNDVKAKLSTILEF